MRIDIEMKIEMKMEIEMKIRCKRTTFSSKKLLPGEGGAGRGRERGGGG